MKREERRGGFSVVVSSVSKIEIIAESEEFITANLVYTRAVQNYFPAQRGGQGQDSSQRRQQDKGASLSSGCMAIG